MAANKDQGQQPLIALTQRAAQALHESVIILGLVDALEEMARSSNNLEYKGSLRRCAQEIKEESKRSEFQGLHTLQDRVRVTRAGVRKRR